MKIGFLVIDMQAIHLQDVEEKVVNRACEYINYVAGMIRSHDHVVIHIQDIEVITEANSEVYRTIPEIEIQDQDIILTKENPNAFWDTELEQILKNHDIEFIVLAGYAAEYCVLFTYNGARERGFNAVILQNGIVSRHQDVITSTYRDRDIISYPVIQYMISK
ncbi:isochorismatase [Paenibacillus sp. E194]|uniref:cysteine hydrolase family protein n=1 Tax=Paenibacillus sp. E194 TaxID=1458845 RepID=UPI0005CA6240|nr:isochorismatase family cysteine hydrolase [Paenibacillus sp. E194]KJB87707.1 isochorismatase [Paenibacillus sp. E194]